MLTAVCQYPLLMVDKPDHGLWWGAGRQTWPTAGRQRPSPIMIEVSLTAIVHVLLVSAMQAPTPPRNNPLDDQVNSEDLGVSPPCNVMDGMLVPLHRY